MFRGSDNEIAWRYVAPEHLLSDDPNFYQGKVAGSNDDLKAAFDRMLNAERIRQAERRRKEVFPFPKNQDVKADKVKPEDEAGNPGGVLFTLLLLTEDGGQSIYPLILKDRKALIEESELKEVFSDIKSKRLWGKVNNMLELFYLSPDVLRATGTIKGEPSEE